MNEWGFYGRFDELRQLEAIVLSRQIQRFWDRTDIEIDLVAISDDERVVRFGSCKRNAGRLLGSLDNLRNHAARSLHHHPALAHYRHEYVAIAPRIEPELRDELAHRGAMAQDLIDLTRWNSAP